MFKSRGARGGGGGFTLMELMVTMAIAASLMGLGAKLFTSMGKRTAAQNALAAVSSLVVNVRNASSRFPAMLVVDPEAGSVQAMAQEVRQELHFDPRSFEGVAEPQVANGIEGRDCDFLGMTVEPTSGRVGGALRLIGGSVNCGSYTAYDVTDGISVELYIKPDGFDAADLVSKGDALRVQLQPGGRLTATIGVNDDHGVEKVSVAGAVSGWRRGQWLGIRVSYDRTRLTLETDSGFGWVERGKKDEARRLTVSADASLTVGGFSGLLDDFRLAGVHSTEPVLMPQGVKLVGTKSYVIHFTGGRLDPAVHLGVERVGIEWTGRRTTLEIAANGMLSVSYLDLDPAAAEAPDADPKVPALPKKE